MRARREREGGADGKAAGEADVDTDGHALDGAEAAVEQLLELARKHEDRDAAEERGSSRVIGMARGESGFSREQKG